jgi:hypothetical protein
MGEDWSRWISVATHLFQLAQLGIFSVWQVFPSFRVLNFWGCFEALNIVLRDHYDQNLVRVTFLWPNVYSFYIPFQWDIVRIKRRLYEKVTTPGS